MHHYIPIFYFLIFHKNILDGVLQNEKGLTFFKNSKKKKKNTARTCEDTRPAHDILLQGE
jgi:hypothetical protein